MRECMVISLILVGVLIAALVLVFVVGYRQGYSDAAYNTKIEVRELLINDHKLRMTRCFKC